MTAHRMEDVLYLVQWNIERRLFEKREEWSEKAVEACVFDGRHKARVTQYRRFMFGWSYDGWSERARFDDTIGRCIFCTEGFPSLEGTALENCRLREFIEATKDTESCYPVAWLRLWEKHKNADVLIDAVLEAAAGSGKSPESVAGYLKKQGRRAVYLQDYWCMAADCRLDLAHERVRWPKELTRAHDETMELQRKLKREKEAAENAEKWAEMNERLCGLAWERGGICIRPAASTQELVAEGKVLHHCVGGYTDSHLQGNIILFIRHARRPERSWFTLNINLKNRTRIQLHGYGNERAHGKKLHIPKEVLEFVDAWEKEVLAKWQDPETMKGKKHGNRTAAA